MRCRQCGSEDIDYVETGCVDPTDPSETLAFIVCASCDYGINAHTEGGCECAPVGPWAARHQPTGSESGDG